MVIVSCSAKFHAFNLAEQLERHRQLTGLWTAYAYQKNTIAQKFVSRVDTEQIPAKKIHSAVPLAAAMKLYPKPELWNDLYDRWVAQSIKNQADAYKILIGWSGMCSNTLMQAKKSGKIAVVERGSSHILYQDKLLKQEYKKFGINFAVHPDVIKKELKEYETADYISIPSTFVKNSFLAYNIPEHKLIQNPYGCKMSLFAQAAGMRREHPEGKFVILYLGRLSIRKGLIYLFRALEALQTKFPQVEPWFIGSVEADFEKTVSEYRTRNPHWKFHGHIPQTQLPAYLSQCSIAVQPSLEEGLSMVIPQLLSSGIPVVATRNSGGEDIIEDGKTGFVIPIEDPKAIEEKLALLVDSPDLQHTLRTNLSAQSFNYSWDQYGKRWNETVYQLLSAHA